MSNTQVQLPTEFLRLMTVGIADGCHLHDAFPKTQKDFGRDTSRRFSRRLALEETPHAQGVQEILNGHGAYDNGSPLLPLQKLFTFQPSNSLAQRRTRDP